MFRACPASGVKRVRFLSFAGHIFPGEQLQDVLVRCGLLVSDCWQWFLQRLHSSSLGLGRWFFPDGVGLYMVAAALIYKFLNYLNDPEVRSAAREAAKECATECMI